MARVLVVHNPFGGFEKGHRITDPAAIEEILAGEHAYHVVPSDHDIKAEENSDSKEA
jgi:hypothetical protein